MIVPVKSIGTDGIDDDDNDDLTLAHFPEIYVPVGAVLQRAVV